MGETASSSRLDGRIIAHRRCPSRKELFLLLRIGKLAGLAGAAIEPKPQKSELRVLGELHGLRMVKFKFKIWINRPSSSAQSLASVPSTITTTRDERDLHIYAPRCPGTSRRNTNTNGRIPVP